MFACPLAFRVPGSPDVAQSLIRHADSTSGRNRRGWWRTLGLVDDEVEVWACLDFPALGPILVESA